MSISIKVCGISTEADIDNAIALGIEMVGLVFFEKSPRHLEIDRASYLSRRGGDKIKKVLVTVDANYELLSFLTDAIKPQILQLHGSETPEMVRSIREKLCLPVMKSVGIKGEQEISQISNYESVSDYLLFEAKAEAYSDRPGGNGISFDWSLLREIKLSKPWFIAGGLNSLNVEKAIHLSGAQGVDVSSGVECAPGVKDVSKIKQFVREVRLAEINPVRNPPAPSFV